MDQPTVTLHPEAEGHDHARRWLAHVEGSHESTTFMGTLEAGRIGQPQPIGPENLANIRRWEAVLLAGRLYRSPLHSGVRCWSAGK